MGVDLTTYRSRIGTFGHSVGVDVVTVVCCVNFFGGLKTAGSVVFIGILLLIAGIESNPGPSSKDKTKHKQVSIIPGNANGRKALTPEERKRTATIELKDIQAYPAKRRLIFETQTRDKAKNKQTVAASTIPGNADVRNVFTGRLRKRAATEAGLKAVKPPAAKRPSETCIFKTQEKDQAKTEQLVSIIPGNANGREKVTGKQRKRTAPKKLKEQHNWDVILQTIELTGKCPEEKLNAQEILPDRKQLNKLLKLHFRSKSDTTLTVLKHVEDIAQKVLKSKYRKVKNIWLAYRYDGKLRGGVIMVNANCKAEDINFLDLETCVYTQDDLSEEAGKITDYCEENKIDHFESFEELAAIRRCINDIADELMKRHRFLSIIKPSPVISKGFSSSNHTIVKESCIALYAQKKGYIPVSEEPFEHNYQGVKVDVREGAFHACMQTDRENIKTLKMGIKISRVGTTLDAPASDSYGTLGGFLEHPEYGTCGITAAHVLLNNDEMTKLQEKRVLTWLDFKQDILVKVCENDEFHIGRVVKAIYRKGDRSSIGFEVAIFQINDDVQTVGAFWNATVKGDDKKHCFDVGRACSTSRLSTSSDVVKFGATTGKTEGKLTEVLPSVTIDLKLDGLPDPIVLKNQIEIRGDRNSYFGKKGDSGSLVMVKGADGETSCVGIFEGTMNDKTCAVSPVGPILERLNVSSLKCFQQKQLLDAVDTLQVGVKKILTILQKSK